MGNGNDWGDQSGGGDWSSDDDQGGDWGGQSGQDDWGASGEDEPEVAHDYQLSQNSEGSDEPLPEFRDDADLKAHMTEGWGEGSFDFNAFTDKFKEVFQAANASAVLKAYVGLAAIALVADLVTSSSQILGYLLGGNVLGTIVGVFTGILGLVLIPIYVLAGVLQIGLVRPLREELFGEAGRHTDPVETIKSVRPVLWPLVVTTVCTGLAVGLGTAACILPGLAAAFFFVQAPYMTATRELTVIDAMLHSFNRAKRHWALVLAAVVTAFVGSLAAGCFVMAAGWVGGLFYPYSLIFSDIVSWIAFTGVGLAVFLGWMTVFVTIDEREGEMR